MARKRTSDFEKLIMGLAKLPWWLSLVIGVAAWLVLHPVATTPYVVPPGTQPGDMSGILSGQLWRTVAMFGQYLIPFACLMGAIGSIFGRHKRKQLLNNVKTATQPAKAIQNWGQMNISAEPAINPNRTTSSTRINVHLTPITPR
jgi:restriction system protein